MARGLLIAGAIVDVGIAVLIIAISGFIVGSGPESMRAGPWGGALLMAVVLACLAAPVIGFVMERLKRPAGGILVEWLPPMIGIIALMIPPGY